MAADLDRQRARAKARADIQARAAARSAKRKPRKPPTGLRGAPPKMNAAAKPQPKTRPQPPSSIGGTMNAIQRRNKMLRNI